MSSSPRTRILAFASLPLALGLAGCFSMDGTINGEAGVPLSELDTAGSTPLELIVQGPDDVILTEGDTLSIDVEGGDDAVAAVRFVIDEDFLGITREQGSWDYASPATIRVTMPAPRDIAVSGSGSVEANALAQNAEVALSGSGSFASGDVEVQSIEVHVSGSGSAKFGKITAEALELSLSGSGSVYGEGNTERLNASLSGSSGIDFAKLKADDARLSVSGSGSVNLQSDGTVTADLSGSGSVRVTGTAKCTERASGSGSLNCSG
ncbi:head GIN domain-containing protein [uncultured Erythrobacter sp.]|uniref:head GIN domain-containing protein n=1 Tax=uncultured Erythrobacter sp. TaxID=263913 RepID=UPI00261707E7|nr:head GIN domain-containing protein [uncultured Erythrobacter sp.]